MQMTVPRALFLCSLTVLILAAFFMYHPVATAQELTPQERAALQSQYDELQKEIAAQQVILDATRAKKNTLKGDVTALTAQINKAQAEIDAKNIQLKQLASQIVSKNKVISQLEGRIAAGHESLAGMLRQVSQTDDYSVVEIALSSGDLSTFFADADAFASVEVNLQTLFSDIRNAKAQTETEKAALTDTQNKVTDARYEVQTKQKQIAGDKTQKQQLLAITTNQEATYQKVLAANQAKAAAIRAALFPLRDAAAIQFGTALKYAQAAQISTGVDPALVLAILTQESNLGANVGQCYLTDESSGAGVGKNTGTAFYNVMNPSRDVPPFLALASALGFDPHHQVVSCPIASAGGWGGAMGPAQFIPSTWSVLASSIASARGIATANPWDPQDAITAMSIYLGNLGAGVGGYTAEHMAAAKYYAGGAWATAGRSYANQVMAKVAAIQSNIDFLANN
jgi:peptidoglycan hydrolase CwlO-like protein